MGGNTADSLRYWYFLDYDFFRDLPDVKQRILHGAKEKCFKRSGMVFWQGQKAVYCYYIGAGAVKIYQTTPSGRDSTIFIRSAGEVFGLADMLNNTPRKCSAQALASSVIHQIDAEAFWDATRSSFEFTRRMMKLLGQRLHFLSDQIRDLADCDVATRVLKTFIRLSYREIMDSRGRGEPVEVPVRLTQSEVASLVGSSQPTISDALRRLQDSNIIRIHRKTITLLDIEQIFSQMHH